MSQHNQITNDCVRGCKFESFERRLSSSGSEADHKKTTRQ